LEELKARRFTLIGKEERIARSLAALREPPPFQLTLQDWERLEQTSDIEDEFE
jgi:hypothetical protein